MKTKSLLVCLITGLNAIAQSPICFTTPDGLDGSNWSYKDYIIPTGYKLDSVFMDATRPGPASTNDFVLESCAGTTTYNSSVGTYPFDYNIVNSSMYNIWINLTSFNYTSVGMVRVSLPTNAGAVWNQVCFAISPVLSNCGILTDTRDGQQYQTVTIGTQCWMQKNLNYGTQVTDITAMTNNSIVEKACYNDSVSDCNLYGGIYTFDEAMNYSGTNQQGICPTGSHIPSQTEWQVLINYLGASTAGQQLKATSTNNPSWDGTNTSGFTALPSGIGQGSSYLHKNSRTTFWSSTASDASNAYDYDLNSGSMTLDEAPNLKSSGYCIRCIMNSMTTGMEKNDKEQINIYPNPADQYIMITGVKSILNIEIYNAIGQCVKSIKNTPSIIDISDLNKGFYFIRLNDNTNIKIIRFIKK